MTAIGNFNTVVAVSSAPAVPPEEDLNEKYAVEVVDGVVTVAEKTNQLVLANYNPQKRFSVQHPCTDWHSHNGIFYFVLESPDYRNCKYVFGFNPSNKRLACLFGPLQHPQFIRNLLVHFGSGFEVPGTIIERDITMLAGEGYIKIYDLTQTSEKRLVKEIKLTEGGCGGWEGSIDHEKKEIDAFGYVKGKQVRIPLGEFLK